MPRDLLGTRRSKAYNRELIKAWLSLCLFSETFFSGPIDLEKATIANLCVLLVSFVQHLYETRGRGAFNRAKHAILSVQIFIPRSRGKLRSAWDALESWNSEIPKSMRTAIPLPVCLAMAIVARIISFTTSGMEAYNWMVFSVFLEVGFFGMLRPASELLKLRRGMISLPGDVFSVGAQFAIVAVLSPKNKKQMGNIQFAMIRSLQATKWLSWICEGLMSDDKLWLPDAEDFRKRVKTVAKYLKLDGWNILPSSLRPGGTTYFFTSGTEASRLVHWGRWSNERTLKHYIQECVAAQVLMESTVESQKLVHALLKHGFDFLEVPSQPWWTFLYRPRFVAPSKTTSASTSASTSPAAWQSLYPPFQHVQGAGEV